MALLSTIELEQYRADGSRIPEYAVEPRWLTIELAEGQLVQFSERGRLNPEAVKVNVQLRMRCAVRDADTRRTLTGPESFFTIWLDRVVFRPGERWSWPAESGAGFVEGALAQAPLESRIPIYRPASFGLQRCLGGYADRRQIQPEPEIGPLGAGSRDAGILVPSRWRTPSSLANESSSIRSLMGTACKLACRHGSSRARANSSS